MTDDRLFVALNDALARVHEWDGLADKLAVFGIEEHELHELARDRLESHGVAPEDEFVFVRGFIEGLVTGMQVAQNMERDRG